jgi:hypothetical protein
MVATWALTYPGAAEKADLVIILGWAYGGYLMAKMTPFLMLRIKMTSSMLRDADSAGKDRQSRPGARTSTVRD